MTLETFLHQDDADRLFSSTTGMGDQSQSSRDEEIAPGVRRYNLGSPDRVVRRRMQTLELINERFMRRLRITLFNFLRRNADVSVGGIEVLKYSDFERNLPVPSNLNVVNLDPLKGAGLFVFDPKMVFSVIETLFGGQARTTTRIEGRDFTTTEQRIIERLINLTLQSYSDAWEPVYPIEPKYMRSEMHTKFASITDGNEIVVVTRFHIEFGVTGGVLHVCLPYSTLEPIRDLLIRPFQEAGEFTADTHWANQLSQQVQNAHVDVRALFATIGINLQTLAQLKVGDVLPFDVPTSVSAHIGHVPIFECDYGTHDKRYALRVEKPLMSTEQLQHVAHAAQSDKQQS